MELWVSWYNGLRLISLNTERFGWPWDIIIVPLYHSKHTANTKSRDLRNGFRGLKIKNKSSDFGFGIKLLFGHPPLRSYLLHPIERNTLFLRQVSLCNICSINCHFIGINSLVNIQIKSPSMCRHLCSLSSSWTRLQVVPQKHRKLNNSQPLIRMTIKIHRLLSFHLIVHAQPTNRHDVLNIYLLPISRNKILQH